MLLEFDQVRQQLAEYTRTVIGREQALSLSPSIDLLEVATGQQETSEARQLLDKGGGLEFGPGIDFRGYVNRGLLGGFLRGEELHAVRGLAEAVRHNRSALSRHEEIPLLAGLADNLPDLSDLVRSIAAAISPAGEFSLGPIPDDIYTVQGEYRQSAVVLAADGDTPGAPAAFHGIIVWRALMMLAEFDEAVEDRAAAAIKYAALLEDLQRDQLPVVSLGGLPIA